MEEMKITGIAKDENVARLTVRQVSDKPGSAFRVLNAVARAGINVDMIIQSAGRAGSGTNDISFSVAEDEAQAAYDALEAHKEAIGYDHVSVDTDIAKISVVGAAMMSSIGIAALVFEALNDEHINIQMINTSEIKISIVIDAASADRAVAAIHRRIFES